MSYSNCRNPLKFNFSIGVEQISSEIIKINLEQKAVKSETRPRKGQPAIVKENRKPQEGVREEGTIENLHHIEGFLICRTIENYQIFLFVQQLKHQIFTFANKGANSNQPRPNTF